MGKKYDNYISGVFLLKIKTIEDVCTEPEATLKTHYATPTLVIAVAVPGSAIPYSRWVHYRNKFGCVIKMQTQDTQNLL